MLNDLLWVADDVKSSRAEWKTPAGWLDRSRKPCITHFPPQLDGGRDSSETHQPYTATVNVQRHWSSLPKRCYLSYKRRLASGLQRICQLAPCTTQASDGNHPPPTHEQGTRIPFPVRNLITQRALTRCDDSRANQCFFTLQPNGQSSITGLKIGVV